MIDEKDDDDDDDLNLSLTINSLRIVVEKLLWCNGRGWVSKHRVGRAYCSCSLATLCPLVWPNKTLALEAQIEPWLTPNRCLFSISQDWLSVFTMTMSFLIILSCCLDFTLNQVTALIVGLEVLRNLVGLAFKKVFFRPGKRSFFLDILFYRTWC